jgi:starvation-inducible DNA-binding protein
MTLDPTDQMNQTVTQAMNIKDAKSQRMAPLGTASTSLLETWIDEAERRTWFLFEAGRPGEPVGHAGGA